LLAAFVATLCSVSPAGVQNPPRTIEEPKSEVEFPIEKQALGSERVEVVTGTGLRTKTIFRVKVYAFALYVDADGARKHLAKWKGRSANQLADDKTFYEALLKDDFGKSLRLVMTRNVDGDDMAEAFDDVLAPRLKKAEKKLEMPGGMEAMKVFRAYFDVDEVEEDTVLDFSWHPGGKLVTAIGGKVMGTIENKALCWALFDVYLGKDPIEEKGKASVIARFPNLLAAGD
jgi:hypothetical protein